MTDINEALTKTLKTDDNVEFVAESSDASFRRAVSWFYHGESVEEILNETDFKGDIAKVEATAKYLEMLDLDYDDVYAWGEAE